MVRPELRKILTQRNGVAQHPGLIYLVAALEIGVKRNITHIGARLETAIERVTGPPSDRGRFGVTANASIDKASDSFYLP